MRSLALLLGFAAVIAFSACQHADSAERSAEITSKAQPAPAAALVAAPAPAPAEHHSCGCGMSSGCTGQCGGQCGGEAPNLVAPADATWTTLHVTGMHCGGCARRIERALAKVDGVVGVKADYAKAEVKVAAKDGADARHLVQQAIDGLGYHVE